MGVMTSDETALLPGYYVDAAFQYAMTETAGLYLGAIYQSSGDYVQEVTSGDELAEVFHPGGPERASGHTGRHVLQVLKFGHENLALPPAGCDFAAGFFVTIFVVCDGRRMKFC